MNKTKRPSAGVRACDMATPWRRTKASGRAYATINGKFVATVRCVGQVWAHIFSGQFITPGVYLETPNDPQARWSRRG